MAGTSEKSLCFCFKRVSDSLRKQAVSGGGDGVLALCGAGGDKAFDQFVAVFLIRDDLRQLHGHFPGVFRRARNNFALQVMSVSSCYGVFSQETNSCRGFKAPTDLRRS